MPPRIRAGLTTEKVTTAAAEIADEHGLDRLSLSAVARRFGVADASLYSHVGGLADLRARVSRVARAELAERLEVAVAGRAGADALAAFAQAHRRYARDHPGRMDAVEDPPAPTVDDGGDGARIVRSSYAPVGTYGLVEPDLTDAVRFVRSTLHGFTDIERRAHFHDPASVDVSFARVVDALDAALTHWPPRPGPPPVGATRHRLVLADAVIPYELRGSGPLLVLVGAPTTRANHAALAAVLAEDHTVLTYDPRGFGDSERRDEGDLTPPALADDLAVLLDGLGAGPARLVGCSGAGVVALTLALARPDLVAGVLAHEPPMVRLLDDPVLLERVLAVREAYRAGGAEAGMGALAALVSGKPVEVPGDRPDDPSDDGTTGRDVASFLGDLLAPTLRSEVDPAALAGIPGLVVAAGAESAGELPHRCAVTLAERTGAPLVTAPGGHTGAGTHPAGFAALVRATAGPLEPAPPPGRTSAQ